MINQVDNENEDRSRTGSGTGGGVLKTSNGKKGLVLIGLIVAVVVAVLFFA